jgi:PTH1 family peptidyl-tRNA hydrolase
LRLLVGLGNPGPKYVATRHNFGFLCLDEVSRRYALSSEKARWILRERSRRDGVAGWELWQGPEGAEVALLWPLTYMNLSGQAVEWLLSRLDAEIPPEEILVVVDDMSLPLGQLRLRRRGSSGGHNGLKSLEALFGSGDYPRLRLGIGQPGPEESVVEFVLSPFATSEAAAVNGVASFAAEAAMEWAQGVSFDGLVGKVNGWRWSEHGPESSNKEVTP